MKRTLAFLFLSLGLLAFTHGTSANPSFSRSRWIAEQMAWGARFSGGVSGGVMPADPRRIEALLDIAGKARAPRTGLPAGVVRVSGDLLAPADGPAQPETEAEPFLAIDPGNSNHLLAGYQEDRFEDGGCRALAYAVSLNAGRTWREGLLPNLTVATGGRYQRVSDPWVAYGPGGRAYYVSLAFNSTSSDNGVFVSASENGGLTWGDPVAVHTADGRTTFDDKESIVVDNRSDSPFRGRIYVGWDSVGSDRSQKIFLSYSDDGGGSFHAPILLYGQGANIGIVPVVGPGGVLHAIWTRYLGQSGSILASSSTDGGDTWSPPATIADNEAGGVEGARTGDGLPAVAVDGRTGSLYVAWQDDRFTPGVDQVVLSRSTDGGQTWSEPQLVSDGPGDAPNFTPAVAVNPQGRVGISYYSLRNDPDRSVLVDEYLAVSRDGGRSFGKSLRVSAASWDLRSASLAGGFFLGDYQGLAAGPGRFHPLWIATYLPSRVDPPARQPDAVTRLMRAR